MLRTARRSRGAGFLQHTQAIPRFRASPMSQSPALNAPAGMFLKDWPRKQKACWARLSLLLSRGPGGVAVHRMRLLVALLQRLCFS